MEKLKSFLNSYFFLIVPLILITVGMLAFSVGSAYFSQNTIRARQTEANKALGAAANANTNAANFDETRRTEDVIREQTIAPKLERARRDSQNSKIEVEKAKKKLNETNKTLHNSNVSRADNCSELKQLFPNETFAYCQ